MLVVKIKRDEENSDLPLPTKMSEGASGYDIFAAVKENVVIKPAEIALIPTGFSLEIPAGYEAQIRPRSGLAIKHGISLVNTPGTIDADYRGEVKLIIINHGQDAFTIKRGDRVAQMVFVELPAIRLVEDDELKLTDRGAGGFGHTGL